MNDAFWRLVFIVSSVALAIGIAVPHPPLQGGGGRSFPWHTNIPATTFWVGEVFDPDAEDGSQVYSAWDDDWMDHYGGCDGVVRHGVCGTERRYASNGWFPRHMTPKQNPFYISLPYDDVNHPQASARRAEFIPWADDPAYREALEEPDTSLMKNRWVELRSAGRSCFAQVQDAGPGQYFDHEYVFGSDDARPRNRRYDGSGTDVSPAVNGCLRFRQLNGTTDRVDWRFVEFEDVPPGPWRRIVTR